MTHTGEGAGRSEFLSVRDVSVSFGGIRALTGMSLDVERGQRVGLIGPNGAGKTTLFNCISRLIRESEGSLQFKGTNLSGVARHKILDLGIARTFQGVAMVKDLSVIENVKGGHGSLRQRSVLSQAIVPPRWSRAERELDERAWDLLERIGIAEYGEALPLDLPFGTQKRVELARALMSAPELLMLDEPANGLTLTEVAELEALIRELCDDLDVTLLVVEHNMGFVNSLCDRVFVMESGSLLAVGTPEEIQSNQQVISAYLGTEFEGAA